jgi:uncharacterized protein YecE (DUF72 family)
VSSSLISSTEPDSLVYRFIGLHLLYYYVRSSSRHNYLYSDEELKPWVDKVKRIVTEAAVVRGYFNNHYGARAVVNAIEFKEMLGTVLSDKEKAVVENARSFFFETSGQSRLDDSLKTA